MRTEMFAYVFHPWRLNTARHLVGAQQISVQRRRMWMKCVGLSQDDSPCVLHSGPALPPEQPRRSSVRKCSLEAGSGVGPGEKCWESKGSQEQEKNSLSIVPRSSCQQHPLPKKLPLSPSCELPPQCPALALGLPTYSRSQHSSGVQSGRPRLVNSFFKKIHTLVGNTVALAPVLVPRDQM